jgi:hypothetical protein
MATDIEIKKALMVLEGGSRTMGRAQEKFLLNRLSEDHGRWYSLPEEDKKPPIAVINARKIVQKWEKSIFQKKKKLSKIRDNARLSVREIIYGGDYVKALAALKKFEQTKF